MRAIEVTGIVDEQGQLSLDKPIEITSLSPVRVIILFETTTSDPDDESLESVKASLRQSLEEARAGDRLPLSQMWEGIDAD